MTETEQFETFMRNYQNMVFSTAIRLLANESEAQDISQEVFLKANFASLTREAAQGQGEHLSAFAEVLGCDHGAFSRMSQEKYNEIYSTTESQEVLQNYVRQIKANPELSTRCTRVS